MKLSAFKLRVLKSCPPSNRGTAPLRWIERLVYFPDGNPNGRGAIARALHRMAGLGLVTFNPAWPRRYGRTVKGDAVLQQAQTPRERKERRDDA